jgi:putative nucleotidyltransferase with HDIG domain
MDFNFDVVNQSHDLKGPEKVQLLAHTSQVCTEVAFGSNIDEETMRSAVSMATESVRMLSSAGDIMTLLEQLDTQMPSIYTHSVATSVLATLIAKQHGWTSPRTQVKTAMCALFHDIGKRDIDFEILTKEKSKRTPAEVELIESHPFRGRDILLATKSMPEEVAQVAFEHHETTNGTGYPMKASGPTILPMSKLVYLADLFITLTMPLETGPKPMTSQEAINHIVTHHFEQVDHDFLKALGAVFNGSTFDGTRHQKAS